MKNINYRMYYGLKATVIENMLNAYLEFILGYNWFGNKHGKKFFRDKEVKLYKDTLHINHHLDYENRDNIIDDHRLIMDKLVQELGIDDERIIKNEELDIWTLHINIKIDKDFIYALVGRLKLLGYKG